MDSTTRTRLEDLRSLRNDLSRVDTDYEPQIAEARRAELHRVIADLETVLHGTVERLDTQIRLFADLRGSYTLRMDREDILRALGLFEEPEPRDTPKLDNLMNNPGFTFGPGGVIEAVAEARKDFKPSLEELLLVGHDKALEAWVEDLNPSETNIMRIMLPRLLRMLLEQAPEPVEMRYTDKPEFVFRDKPVLNEADMRRIRTQHLVDLEPGTFDD